jgi:hypothetical protein
VAAGAVFVGFHGRTVSLIPLFAVGVFLAFTLSQTGMVAHGLRSRGPGWRRRLAFNALGCVLSALVFVVVGLTKFDEGAWTVVLLIPSIVLGLLAIHRHYAWVREATALRPLPPHARRRPIVPHRWPTERLPAAEAEEAPDQLQPLCVVPVTELDLPNLRALAYAASLRQPTLAVHISPDREDRDCFLRAWRAWGDHLPLEVVSSPYRALVPPLAHYLRALRAQRAQLTITVVMSDLVVTAWWQRLLHERSGSRIQAALRAEPNTVVTVVPFHVPAPAGVRAHPDRPLGRLQKSDSAADASRVALGQHSTR